ncbi:hypothetical protein CgunFtcFv8_004707 [Champsocephalus gunnari]|uniref:Uncharacterized protein n=1 Tax=Champsocephalus gunnari TaxID=52237 RepID=A0AAN8HXT8_CHAGU|nr:hypothetical protein CgunFtcFv8_004707 [Champsocephalus gunnari]
MTPSLMLIITRIRASLLRRHISEEPAATREPSGLGCRRDGSNMSSHISSSVCEQSRGTSPRSLLMALTEE